jgi:MFS family permease
MMTLNQRISRLFSPAQPIPSEYRSNFFHLYFDVIWFGILNGSTLSFLAIYATRLGASGLQIGLINAVPAIVTLIFAIPASSWLGQRSIRRGVFWSALIFRLFYALLIPLPALLIPNLQVWVIIVITLIMNVPGTALAVGFNALFAETVPVEWRGHVAGIRNALISLSSTLTTLLCGYLLTHLPFQYGYQIVFGLGFGGAILSTIHVGLIRPVEKPMTGLDQSLKSQTSGMKKSVKQNIFEKLACQFRMDIIRGPFGRTVLLLFFFHFSQYLAIPVFPYYMVNSLHFTDQILGFGSSIFNILTFLGSLRVAHFARIYGNRKIISIGIVMVAFYPAIMAVAHGVFLYMLASIIGGLAWALIGGVLFNYLLEKVPDYDRPGYLAWYTLGLNAAILMGSLLGPALAGQMGMVTAMVLFAILRGLAGIAVLRWG